MNTNTLTDTELNRAMIWLYPEKENYDGYYDEYMGWNYVEDWNLTMPLVIQHEIFIGPVNQGELWFAHDNICNRFRAYDDSPLRAICQVLVQIRMEEMK